MEALRLFAKNAPNKTFLAVILGIINGVLFAMLVPLIMTSLSANNTQLEYENQLIEILGLEVSNPKLAAVYFGLCLVIISLKVISEVMLSRIALEVRLDLRNQLYKRVQRTSIQSLENIGSSKLIESLSTDVSIIVTAASLYPKILTQGFTILGMLSFLAYIDSAVFSLVFKVMIFGVLCYQIPILIGTRYFAQAREYRDLLQQSFKGLIAGAKELKLNEHKKNIYHSKILNGYEQKVMEPEKTGFTIYIVATSFSDLLSFITIGCVSFIFINYSFVSTAEIVSVVMILLYITGPISSLLSFLPELEKSKVSLNKMDRIYSNLPPEDVVFNCSTVKQWDTLTLKSVFYKYPSSSTQGHPFEIGPINLDIKKGEVTFIVGGNGSGKSTLAKLITQHYLPTKGVISYDDVVISGENINSFRQEISCIYSDYYLFEDLLNEESNSEKTQEQIDHYLELFGLKSKVQFVNGKFSTLKLSDGQRRRLALIAAMFENKSLLLFDEWAADQDPEFKSIFYKEILPMLKTQNKSVVVISHDDRFFHIADRVIVMESGKLVRDSLVGNVSGF